MNDELVIYETDGPIGIISLNRPNKLNAISHDLMVALQESFAEADSDPNTCVVVLRGNGRTFCAGFDMQGNEKKSALHWSERLLNEMAFEITPWTMRKPVVASVQGHVLGGGCQLAMMCDLVIAAEDTKFGEPEIRFAVSGPVYITPWIIGMRRAKELLYFGDMIDAQTALSYGMINRIVPAAELSTATLKYAHRLALIGREALIQTKASLNKGAEAAGIINALQVGADRAVPLYADTTGVRGAFKAKVEAEGVAAAVKWRHAQFKDE